MPGKTANILFAFGTQGDMKIFRAIQEARRELDQLDAATKKATAASEEYGRQTQRAADASAQAIKRTAKAQQEAAAQWTGKSPTPYPYRPGAGATATLTAHEMRQPARQCQGLRPDAGIHRLASPRRHAIRCPGRRPAEGGRAQGGPGDPLPDGQPAGQWPPGGPGR